MTCLDHHLVLQVTIIITSIITLVNGYPNTTHIVVAMSHELILDTENILYTILKQTDRFGHTSIDAIADF